MLEIALTENYVASVATIEADEKPRRRIAAILDTESHVRVTFGLDWGTLSQFYYAYLALKAEREEAGLAT